MKLTSEFYQVIVNTLPHGVFVLNDELVIVEWNAWMASQTSVEKSRALGKKLYELFPNIKNERWEWALEQVLTMGAPQVLSQILNRYLIPIPLDKTESSSFRLMQQHIDILPLRHEGAWFAIVIIEDVTDMVYQKQTLMAMGHKFETQSYHDVLTDIYNRRFMWEWLGKQIEAAKRKNKIIACIMMDIDHFKYINDQFGHSVGDQVLMKFVEVLQSSVRSADVFVRYGGEEFILLMPEVDETQALAIAERYRKLIEANVGAGLKISTVTCSFGVAIWRSQRNKIKAKQLVDEADHALYDAKQSGRNCVKLFEYGMKKR